MSTDRTYYSEVDVPVYYRDITGDVFQDIVAVQMRAILAQHHLDDSWGDSLLSNPYRVRLEVMPL